MTKKDKKLLFKDLCARLPYGVICTDNRHGDSRVFYIDVEDEKVYYTDFDEYGLIEYCMPYLRSMSSMTEREKKEFQHIAGGITLDNSIVRSGYCINYDTISKIEDWLNEHQFDYRGLIPKGLALEAKKGMYKKQ